MNSDKITTDAKGRELVVATSFANFHSVFWNNNGPLINKWCRGEKLLPDEIYIFREYLTKVSKLYLPETPINVKTMSIDDILSMLLDVGVDPL